VAPIGTPVDSLPDDLPLAPVGKKPLALPARPAAPVVDDLLTDEVPGALPARARPSRVPLLLAAATALLVVALGGWGFAVREERQRTKRRFLAVCARAPAAAVLRQADALPAWLRDDADVLAAIADARARLAGEQARASAANLLARLEAAATLAEWRTICDEASAADPTWGEPLARRAEATLALARGTAVARGDTSFAVAREALRELDLASEREPAQAADYRLRRARLCLSAPGDLDERRTAARSAAEAAWRSAPAGGVVGLLAQARLGALEGAWQDVVERCDRALTLEPERADAYLLRAEARLRLGQLPEAIDDARRARARERWSLDAVLVEVEARALGPRSLGEGARLLATEELTRVLELDPTHPRALAARSYLRLLRDRVGLVRSPAADHEAARQDAEHALRLDSTQALAHATLAELAFARRDAAAARLAATRAVTHGQHFAELHLLRGRLRARLGDAGALEDFDQVLRLRLDPRAHANRAALLLAQGKVPEARRAADEALAIDTQLPEAYFQRGLALYKSTPPRLQEAVNDFSRALTLDPGLADAAFYRACVLFDARMYPEALADLGRAELAHQVRGAFHLREVYLLRGHCLFRQRRWAEAEAAYDEYLRRSAGRTPAPTATRRRELAAGVRAGRVREATIDVERE
jgi:tetratricopeptide (TPR) repeat protein